jgi:inhibitor of KinA
LDQDFNIFPLGDAAATIDFGNSISRELNRHVRRLQTWFAQNPFEGLKDVIAAYSSLSLFYDPVLVKTSQQVTGSIYSFIKERLEEAWQQAAALPFAEPEETILIPVCYDDFFGHDLDFIAASNQLSKQDIIELHTSGLYYVYMIGFLPGFSYMAEVDERLVMPRKPIPVQVAAGSVGIAGSQTGIYPLICPGGWQIVGRTPVSMFDPGAPIPAVLKPGDRVQFYQISREEFDQGNWGRPQGAGAGP